MVQSYHVLCSVQAMRTPVYGLQSCQRWQKVLQQPNHEERSYGKSTTSQRSLFIKTWIPILSCFLFLPIEDELIPKINRQRHITNRHLLTIRH
jgi:hypothetical protein